MDYRLLAIKFLLLILCICFTFFLTDVRKIEKVKPVYKSKSLRILIFCCSGSSLLLAFYMYNKWIQLLFFVSITSFIVFAIILHRVVIFPKYIKDYNLKNKK